MEVVMKLFLTLVALLLIVEGCGGARLKHQYHQAQLDLNSKGDGQVAVTVGDKRPYVVSGDKTSTFTGLMRNNFGMPFNITTESGNALAHDMATVVVRSLAAKGFSSSEVVVPPGTSSADYIKQNHPRRVLSITIFEWNSHSYAGLFGHETQELKYDVKAEVYDSKGTVLATKNIGGLDNLPVPGGDFFAHSRTAMATAYKGTFERLLNDPKISNAIH
jgi:hypothetical protein